MYNKIISSVEDKYINHLKHPRAACQAVEPLQIRAHLLTTYGMIDDASMIVNEHKTNTQWNPPAAIETLYQELQKGQRYSIIRKVTLG